MKGTPNPILENTEVNKVDENLILFKPGTTRLEALHQFHLYNLRNNKPCNFTEI